MVVPTYNESENLEWIVGRLRAAQPGVDVLVVDDNSPDGTGEIADQLAAADPAVHGACTAPRRPVWARPTSTASTSRCDAGYDVIGEMDADGSHQPEQLHRLLDALHDADLVIGSRYVPGGSVVNWPRPRHAALARRQPLRPAAARASSVQDATAGFRLFRRATLEKIDLAARAGRPATSSRPTWPTAPCAAGCGSSRCRSSSSSGCAATPR